MLPHETALEGMRFTQVALHILIYPWQIRSLLKLFFRRGLLKLDQVIFSNEIAVVGCLKGNGVFS